jgi:hypothetical protein
LPKPVAAAVRLKLWLKIGLRAFGLKCEAVEEIAPEQPDAAGPGLGAPPPREPGQESC